MGRVGPWVTDPKGGFRGGWLSIERLKFFGFSSERVFACNLDAPDGQAAMAFLTTCQSVDEVKARCRSLMSIR